MVNQLLLIAATVGVINFCVKKFIFGRKAIFCFVIGFHVNYNVLNSPICQARAKKLHRFRRYY